MAMPKTFTCPYCDSVWPWEYDYCPKDGRALRRLKQEQLEFPQGRPTPQVVSLQYLPDLLETVFEGHWHNSYPHPNIYSEQAVGRWLSQLRTIDQQKTVMFRYGLDGGGRRTQQQVADMLEVHVGTVRDRLAKAHRQLRRATLERSELD